MNKKYYIIGIIISVIIIIYGIVFFIDTDSYIISNYTFGIDTDTNILMQMQQINVNIIKINNSIHRGIGALISSIGIISVSYFAMSLKKNIQH